MRLGVCAIVLLASCSVDVIHVPVSEPPPTVVPVTAQQKLDSVKSLADIEQKFGFIPGTLSTAASVRLITGDIIAVQFVTHPQFNAEVTVGADGTVVLPKIGAVKAEGLSVEELQREVQIHAEAAGLRNPLVTVNIKTLMKRAITIAGPSISKPGRLEIGVSTRLLDALFSSGIDFQKTSIRQVYVVRNGRNALVDLGSILFDQNTELNITLWDGDLVLTAEKEPVTVSGEVTSGGQFPIPTKGYLNIAEALSLAGGMKASADALAMTLTRKGGTVEQVNLNSSLFAGNPELVKIMPGDNVFVPASTQTTVYVFGMVTKPGAVSVPAPATVSKVLALADPKAFGAVLSNTKVVRSTRSKPDVYTIDAEKLMYKADISQDMKLVPGDVVYVPESGASDVIDTLTRVIPLATAGTRTYVDLYFISQLGRDKK